MFGQPEERDVQQWQAGDTAVMRADLDRALDLDAGSPPPGPVGTTDRPRPTPSAPAESSRPQSDAELIEAVRGGTIQAFGELYARHVQAAHNLARQLSRSPIEADDLVSDAFAKVLTVLRAGGGPDSAFRAYLLTALRHTAYDKVRRERKLDLSDDVHGVSGVEQATAVPFHDTAVARLDRSLAAKAFASLPEHWQTVLWHTEIEGQTPAQVAPLLGLTSNGVSAMAYRAREGLRKAYLQAHLAQTQSERCRATVDRLGAWTRGGLSKRETTQVEAHLDECASCRALTAELADVNGALRGIIAPLVLGVGTAGYLAAGGGKASAAAAAVAAGTGASVPHWLGAVASTAMLAIAIGSGLETPISSTDPTAIAEPPASNAIGHTTTVPIGQTTSSDPAAPSTTQPTTSVAGSGISAPAGTGGPVATATATKPATAAPPAAPVLTPTAPAGFTTSTGGPPTDFPITFRNTGTAPSPPTTLTMSLPDDVKVVGPGNNLRGNSLVGLDGARTQTVGCPAGKGTVTCVAQQELAAGDSVTFIFRLLAGPKAVNGTITATTDSELVVTVPVTITPKK
ncbi:MAG: sigma-70 family RNA polymerase sigma factor [Umezawaea sp.]